MPSIRIAISAMVVMSLAAVTPASTQQAEPGVGGELFEKLQSEFAEAYNRKDVAAMAAFFSLAKTRFVSRRQVFFVAAMPSDANCREW
jgi:hypothetical protein